MPSCDFHNTSKSKDDEYLLYTLLLNVPNNQTATNHFFTKVLLAIGRNPPLINARGKVQMPVKVEGIKTGEIHYTIAVQIDENRLKLSLEMIGRALNFHQHQEPWHGTVDVHSNFLLWLSEPNAEELNEPPAKMAAAIEELVEHEARHGENPEVFCYQIANGHSPVEIIMVLRIYEGSRVTLLIKNEV